MIEIEVPYPPSINHYYRHVGNRVLISLEGRKYRGTVISLVSRLRMQPLLNLLRIEIELYPPDRRRRDIDNVLKTLLDALEHGGLYRNDAQISELKITRLTVISGGKTIVRLWKIK